uniref:Uncharacterized protein n=1 Tax=Oncorhynchus mykiss TaxID=8022 RepID=A0A8C7M6Q2_ONCMY
MHQGAPVDVRACEASSVVKVTIAVRMHLTRPKSSKGRCRPSLSLTPNVDVAVRSLPPSHYHSQLSVDDVPYYLDNVPDLPSLPFPWNKYKPLPSIEKKASEEGVFEWCGGEEIQAQSVRQPTVHSEDPGIIPEQPGDSVTTPKTKSPPVLSPGTPDPRSLLLAIRAPCGRRFEHHFLPTDTLLQRPDMDPDISTVTNQSLFVTLPCSKRLSNCRTRQ